MADRDDDSKTQALAHVERAEGYEKMGLNAQVQHELSEAERLDPDIVHIPRYQSLRSKIASKAQKAQALRNPLRIGAVMLFVNAAMGVFLWLLVLGVGNASDLGVGGFIGPIVNVVIGVNLWQGKEQWQRYTVWWAGIGLVLFGAIALAAGDFVGLIAQLAFSGALILLLAGTPSRGRTLASVIVYVVGYIGFVFAFLALSFIAGFVGAL